MSEFYRQQGHICECVRFAQKKNKMSGRASKILNMILPETNNSTHLRKQELYQDLPVLKESKNSPIHLQEHHSQFLFNYEPTPTNLHDDSFDNNSIPDSQVGLDLDISFDDTSEKESEYPKKPNKVVEESSSDSDDSFFDLKPLAVGNYTVAEDGEKLRWTDIKIIEVDRENRNKFFFKTSYDDAEFKSVSTLTRRQAKSNTVETTTLKKLYAQKLKVPETKTQGIPKLIEKNVIPKYYEVFYSNV